MSNNNEALQNGGGGDHEENRIKRLETVVAEMAAEIAVLKRRLKNLEMIDKEREEDFIEYKRLAPQRHKSSIEITLEKIEETKEEIYEQIEIQDHTFRSNQGQVKRDITIIKQQNQKQQESLAKHQESLTQQQHSLKKLQASIQTNLSLRQIHEEDAKKCLKNGFHIVTYEVTETFEDMYYMSSSAIMSTQEHELYNRTWNFQVKKTCSGKNLRLVLKLIDPPEKPCAVFLTCFAISPLGPVKLFSDMDWYVYDYENYSIYYTVTSWKKLITEGFLSPSDDTLALKIYISFTAEGAGIRLNNSTKIMDQY